MNFVQPIRDLNKIEEIKDILLKQSYRNYILFLIGINSGLKILDILELKVCDVRGKTHIEIQKKKFPIFNITKEINFYIVDMKDNEYLFRSREGMNKAIGRCQAYNILNKAAKKVGLEKIGTNTLRKTFGYHFFKEYKDIKYLQQLFGHSAPSVTIQFIGVNKDMVDNIYKNFK
jgi:integrase